MRYFDIIERFAMAWVLPVVLGIDEAVALSFGVLWIAAYWISR